MNTPPCPGCGADTVRCHQNGVHLVTDINVERKPLKETVIGYGDAYKCASCGHLIVEMPTGYEEVREHVKKVVDYLWDDEERHYEEGLESGEDCDKHIFITLKEIREWLKTDTGKN